MAAYLILTKADRLILDSYKTVLDGFSEYLGKVMNWFSTVWRTWNIRLSRLLTAIIQTGRRGRQSPIWRLRCWSGLENRVPPTPLSISTERMAALLNQLQYQLSAREGELSAFYALICIWTFRFQPCCPHSLMNLRRRLQLRKALMRTWRD